MTDYLEELLDLLTLEDEQEAGEGWMAQAAFLVLPKVLELPEGTAAEEGGSGEGGARSWLYHVRFWCTFTRPLSYENQASSRVCRLPSSAALQK